MLGPPRDEPSQNFVKVSKTQNADRCERPCSYYNAGAVVSTKTRERGTGKYVAVTWMDW